MLANFRQKLFLKISFWITKNFTKNSYCLRIYWLDSFAKKNYEFLQKLSRHVLRNFSFSRDMFKNFSKYSSIAKPSMVYLRNSSSNFIRKSEFLQIFLRTIQGFLYFIQHVEERLRKSVKKILPEFIQKFLQESLLKSSKNISQFLQQLLQIFFQGFLKKYV